MTCKLCSSFTCLKNALIALNIVYILVSFILIGVAAYCRAASVVTNLAIVGGIIACGVFLFFAIGDGSDRCHSASSSYAVFLHADFISIVYHSVQYSLCLFGCNN
ncbi:uncharacterized protein CEXT_139931 [Caerostris extrusa]|uniref:Uncharacterized protein n=1 Tax=Caerostris extrusa TaxID=172846 RepID=A0AAV4XY82_CAEEX|nr:uncharacterized protein CEXT_139931 [Caerostris extrusa]